MGWVCLVWLVRALWGRFRAARKRGTVVWNGGWYSSVVTWAGWYEIVRDRELKVRCRTISVTVSYDIFRKSYDIQSLAVKSPYIGRKSDITRRLTVTLPAQSQELNKNPYYVLFKRIALMELLACLLHVAE